MSQAVQKFNRWINKLFMDTKFNKRHLISFMDLRLAHVSLGKQQCFSKSLYNVLLTKHVLVLFKSLNVTYFVSGERIE